MSSSATTGGRIDHFSFMQNRCVSVRNVPKPFHEDFTRLLGTKCGKVTDWRSGDEVLTIAFEKPNLCDQAISLVQGMIYSGEMVEIVRGSKSEEEKNQLAITGPKGGSGSGLGTDEEEEEQEDEYGDNENDLELERHFLEVGSSLLKLLSGFAISSEDELVPLSGVEEEEEDETSRSSRKK